MNASFTSRLACAAAFAFATTAATFPVAPPALAGQGDVSVQTTSNSARVIRLALSKSTIIDFPQEIRDVLVADPAVADAVVRTNKRLYLLGNKFGTTSVTVFGANGALVGELQLIIQPDSTTLEALLKKLIPGANVSVEVATGTVILRGTVDDPQDAVMAYNVANKFVGEKASSVTNQAGTGSIATASTNTYSAESTIQVLNLIKIRNKDQVMLRVTIAEVQREALKALGVNLQAAVSGGLSATLASANSFGNVSGGVSSVTTLNGGAFNGTTVEALEQQQVLKTLAEPMLTAISGEEANFVAGGEYPVPVSSSTTNGITSLGIEFKKFGIKLNFIPVVLTEGRISLKVATEVSELTNEGAVTLSNTVIPALKTRQAQTTLEMSSGSTMVLAGLIKDDVRQSMTGMPGAMNLPILGSLFRSKDFKRSQTELAIFVQPIIVQPVASNRLQRPDQNLQPSSDGAGYFLGRVNRMYRNTTASTPTAGNYHGQYGYIYE